MGIFGSGGGDYCDEILSLEKKNYSESKRALSSSNKRLKSLKKRKRKATFHHVINKIAAKPISRKQGIEMMFGTNDFKNLYNRK